MDWIALGLGFAGNAFVVVAAVMGVRLNAGALLTSTGDHVFGLDRLVKAIRATSWIVLFGSLAILAGLLVQLVSLLKD